MQKRRHAIQRETAELQARVSAASKATQARDEVESFLQQLAAVRSKTATRAADESPSLANLPAMVHRVRAVMTAPATLDACLETLRTVQQSL